MMSGLGLALFISHSTVMFAGSSTPSAMTAMMPTTIIEAISQLRAVLFGERVPRWNAICRPVASVIVTTVGMMITIFGMNLAVNSARAGGDIEPMIGPTASPTNRSMLVHSAPPATWQNMCGQNLLAAIA